LLELETRIRRKLAQAAASVGVEQEVIPGAATSERVFAETREEIEALRRERADLFETAGEDPNAHSGEEYRQEIRKGLENYGERIQRLPGGAGSGFRGGPAKGHFFCAKVGERVFLRFVPFAEGSPVRDTLGCLRLIACRENTPRELSDELAARAYGAWESARKDIYDEWMKATDPASLQPRVKPSLKAAADQLRKFPPPGLSLQELDRLVESVEAPWGARIERVLRESMDGKSGIDTSTALVEKIRFLGLQPYRPPEPLPPIEEDDIRLVCWMAVDAIS
jgi:hypothetical protein